MQTTDLLQSCLSLSERDRQLCQRLLAGQTTAQSGGDSTRGLCSRLRRRGGFGLLDKAIVVLVELLELFFRTQPLPHGHITIAVAVQSDEPLGDFLFGRRF